MHALDNMYKSRRPDRTLVRRIHKARSDKRGRHRIMAKDLIYAGHVAEQASNSWLLFSVGEKLSKR
jgi:hypothetical protein